MAWAKETSAVSTDFNRIFYPESIAVVGVSADNPVSFGSLIFKALVSMQCESRLYPVNPKGGTFGDFDVYKSVEEIPDEIDFAIVSVAAPLVPETIEACRLKGAAGVEIISAGFKETGEPEGIALEEEIKKIARKGIRVIGPNCFGIYCPESGLTMAPGPDFSRESGPVAFLAQSGGMSVDFAQMGKWMGIRFSKIISFGNGADLRETELLEYLGNDPETEVIALYIEGIDNGRKFFTTLKDVAARKPVIVYKGGLSEAGNRAVTSHTASMGGSRIIWNSLLRQCNAIQVHGLQEMAQASLAFSLLPPREYKGITVVGGGGALGVSACDAAESFNLEIPTLKDDIVEEILSVLPRPGSSATNPIDSANPFVAPGAIKSTLISAARDPRVELQILTQLLYHFKSIATLSGAPSLRHVIPYKKMADAVKEAVDITDKPVIIVLPNLKQELESMEIEEVTRETRALFVERGIPVLDSLNDALRAISHVASYYKKR
ncbi:MAG: CoA-binding protein [Deltaproteobacteria bacterium]|nr:CoA-binding protein [Deltaproteobacteria bacterium]